MNPSDITQSSMEGIFLTAAKDSFALIDMASSASGLMPVAAPDERAALLRLDAP